jgi:hypothetical protein
VQAVHEAGHALSSVLAGGILPQIISVGAGAGPVRAYVKYLYRNSFVSVSELSTLTAQGLGGLIAEEIIFGKREITNGSRKDMEFLYELVSNSLLESGLGQSLLIRKISSVFDSSLPQPREIDVNEVESFINEMADQTRFMLAQQEHALRELAKQLYFRGELNTEEFLDILEATLDKQAFVQYHTMIDKDSDADALPLKDLLKLINFSYVETLFKDQPDGMSAEDLALIGRMLAVSPVMFKHIDGNPQNTHICDTHGQYPETEFPENIVGISEQ